MFRQTVAASAGGGVETEDVTITCIGSACTSRRSPFSDARRTTGVEVGYDVAVMDDQAASDAGDSLTLEIASGGFATSFNTGAANAGTPVTVTATMTQAPSVTNEDDSTPTASPTDDSPATAASSKKSDSTLIAVIVTVVVVVVLIAVLLVVWYMGCFEKKRQPGETSSELHTNEKNPDVPHTALNEA